jgi:hypothetical protein
MEVHRQPLQNRGTNTWTSVNPSRVSVSRIKQRLRNDELFSTSNTELVTWHRVYTKKRYDSSSPHFDKRTVHLNLSYENCWIGRGVSTVLPPILADMTSHIFCLWEQTNKSLYQDRRQIWCKFSRNTMKYFGLKRTNNKGTRKTTFVEIWKWLRNYVAVQITIPRWYKIFT